MKPECGSPSDCHDPGKPLCSAAGACVACGQLAATACKTANPALPVCVASGACVECGSPSDCKDTAKPLCNPAGACVACGQLAATACKTANPALPVCAASGACVECGSSADCKDGAKPLCSPAGACVGCGSLAAGACATQKPALPVCAASGACVECGSSADCKVGTKPICDAGTNSCGACTTDDQCASKLGGNPGVCMAHQDGRCATDSETIYVQNSTGCAGSAGSAAAPVCSLQAAASLLSSRRLVVVRGTVSGGNWPLSGAQVSVIGQMSATIAGGVGSAIHVSGGDLYLRNLSANVSAQPGIVADSGATLRTDGVTVMSNTGGGILLDGAHFDLRNTTVTGNGPGISGAITWGGILVNNPPAAGPTRLQLVTVQNNLASGISCSTSISGMVNGVLASGNAATDVNTTCGFTSCAAAGPTCGAQ